MDWQRVKQIMGEAAARQSAAEQGAYLDAACRDDIQLRAEVEKLLRAHAQAGVFLEEPLCSPPETPVSEQAGDKIGLYKLLQQIGEGGCGVVYMAEQESPIRRRVALKIIKLGMDTKAVVARFEAERQALALMDHPHIARVLDAGATETGRPYFVMELVRGVKITEYCDQNQLSTEARLNLFAQVCHAIQHAHQKGIIHRDIKPSNILVTLQDGRPVPKVIDFGIAKATEGRLTEKTLFTAFEQFIGTPAYMSPEQAQMSPLDIDTRSDIYSLGVLLYELLTGQTPFDQKDLVSAGLDEMRRIIREQEPKRPSTRLGTLAGPDQTTVARYRRAEPPELIHSLQGDVDWIVMRCLEKDRARRYESANSLGEDITRHLNNELVTARPPSRLYQFQKLVQRNKGAFAAGALVTVALVLGLGLSLWTLAQERVARRQALAAEQKAQAEAGKSQQVAQFLKHMLQGVGPSAALGRDTTMLREILEKTAERVGKDLKDQPEVEAELRTTLGEVYQALGKYDQAEEMYRTALKIRRALWGNMNTNVADSLDRLGWQLLSTKVKVAESEPFLEEAWIIRTNLLGNEQVEVAVSLFHLGLLRLWQAKTFEGEELFRRSLAMRRRLLGNEHETVAESLIGLGSALLDLGKPEEAEAVLREGLRIQTRLFPDERAAPGAGHGQITLALALLRQRKLEESEAILRHTSAMRSELLGSDHPDSAIALNRLASVLIAGDKLDEAEKVAREALALSRKTLGDRHPNTAFCLDALGRILRLVSRFPEAEAAYREALDIWWSRGIVNVDHELTQLTELLRDQGRIEEIEVLCREDVATIRHSGTLTRLPYALQLLGYALRNQQKWPEAEKALREAVELTKESPSIDDRLAPLELLIQILTDQRHFAEAQPLLEQAFELARKTSNPWFLPQTYGIAGEKYAAEGNWAQAEAMARAGLEICRSVAPETEQRQWLAAVVANALRQQARWAEAEVFYRECLSVRLKIWPYSVWRWQPILNASAENLQAQGKRAETEALYREGLTAARKPGPSLGLASLLGQLGDLLRNQGRLDEAGRLYSEGLEMYRSFQLDRSETCQWLASGLGVVLRSQGKLAEATDAYLEAVRSSASIWPDNFPRWEWQLRELMDLLVQQGKTAELEKLQNEVSQIKGISKSVQSIFLGAQADAEGRQAKWTEAIERLTEAIKLDPDNQLANFKLVLVQAYTGHLDSYNQLRRQILDRLHGCTNADTCGVIAKACLVFPGDPRDLSTISNWAHIACISAPPSHTLHAWRESTMAHVEYRLEHFTKAAERAEKLVSQEDPIPERNLQTRCILAMAQYRLNRTAEAQATLAQAAEMSRQDLPQPDSGNLGDGWWDYLFARMLLREVVLLIESQPAAGGR